MIELIIFLKRNKIRKKIKKFRGKIKIITVERQLIESIII